MSRIARTCLTAGLIAAGSAALAPLRAQGPRPAGDVEAAVKAVVRKYVEAREARDPKAIEPLLATDADQLVSDGTWRRGRDELVRGMLESSRRTGGRREIRVEAVRLLSDDVAIADGRYTQTGLAGGRDREMWTTIVLKRGPDGWRIAAIRNMLPAAPAQAKAVPEKPAGRAVRYEAEEGRPGDGAAEKRRDYAVLEAALNDLTSPRNPEYKYYLRNVGPRRQIVLDHEMWKGDHGDPGPVSVDIDHKDPRPIPEEIRRDFRRRNDGSAGSLADFRPANPDILVRDVEKLIEKAAGPFTAAEEFFKQYPDAWGYVYAYRPGYSDDGNTALIMFWGGPSPHGEAWVYLLARKGNRWEVHWRHLNIYE